VRKEVKPPRLPSIRSNAVRLTPGVMQQTGADYQAGTCWGFRGGFPHLPVRVDFAGFVLTGVGLRIEPPLGILVSFHRYGASRLNRSTCA
jgi:hypothetical protein